MARPERYFYSPLAGETFLTQYLVARNACVAQLASCSSNATYDPRNDDVDAEIDTARLLAAGPDYGQIDRLVHRFEISRKIHSGYDNDLKKGVGPWDDLGLYAQLAWHVAQKYRTGKSLRDLNALIKLNDMLASQSIAEQAPHCGPLRAALKIEIDAVISLMRNKGLGNAI
jgi:hypothetical protein